MIKLQPGPDASLRAAVRLVVWHVPPRRRGLRLVGLVNRVFPPTPTLIDATYADGIRMSCDLRDAVQSSVYYRGVYEPKVTAMLLEELRPGDTFLDLGANAGYFSLLAARSVGQGGKVHSFEPSSELAGRLRRDAERNRFGHMTVHEVAVSDVPGRAVLAASPDMGAPDGGRFLTSPDHGDPDGTVEVVAIDTYLPDLRFDVGKIDIEGAEIGAIRGMKAAIRRSRPRLLFIEAIEDNLRRFGGSNDELRREMAELGYEGELIVERYFSDMIAFRPVE